QEKILAAVVTSDISCGVVCCCPANLEINSFYAVDMRWFLKRRGRSFSAKPGKRKSLKNNISEALVPWAGIEPARPKTLDFESSASTSSATKASGRQKYEFFRFAIKLK